MGQPAELPGTPLHSSKVPDLPQRAAHQQTVPVADDFDLPPSYEASIHVSGTRARSNRSSVSSTADPHDGLLGAELHASAPQASASAARVDVDTKGYCRTDPMVWAELERSGKWEKHGGKPGCCGSSSGGCCFSSRGGCCFSDREACCFSDREACCFSDRGGCCFSDTGGCCFGSEGGSCCSKGPDPATRR